jgi:signal transduction histidine kinase
VKHKLRHYKMAVGHSIFLKLFLVMLFTGFLVFAVAGWYLNQQFHQRIEKSLKGNIENYCRYLAQDIGSPPDTAKAIAVSRSYQIQISYENNDTKWNSTPTFLPLKEHILFGHRFMENPKWLPLQRYTVTNADGSLYTFTIDHRLYMADHEKRMAHIFLWLLVIFSISIMLMRHILYPIRRLHQGVLQVSQGNLDFTIPVRSADELGVLSTSFNEMTRRIREMIRARDQLLLDVSHELRSPLTRMKLALAMMRQDKNRTAIQNDVNEMETMITELLETERLREGHGRLQLIEANLSDLIRQVAGLLSNSAPGITLDNIPRSIMVTLDEERIKTVLKNVLENALKYSIPESKAVEVTLTEFDEQVTVSIKDDGMGIPPEHLPFIFEPFYRVDKSRSKKTGGYGLGLHMCKQIMEAHGGEISIIKNTARGMTVLLKFASKSQ